jgi:tetratricopeptide (TPR) repeat protein
MKCISALLIAVILLTAAGCKPKVKAISPLQRKEAANLVSEAQFAVTMRDHARAEPLFEKAARLCPNNGEYWISLGVTRRRLGKTSGAKSAYEQARSTYHDAFESDRKQSDALLQELYVLALLGRMDEARETLKKAQKDDPTNKRLRSFAESKQLDRVLAEPGFKDMAL